MRRFYLPAEYMPTDGLGLFFLQGQQARHIAQVLRLRPGDMVEFFDGSGRVLRACLHEVGHAQVRAELVESWKEEVPAHPPLFLAQAILKGKKMDLLVQKATELGVQQFIPVVSRYCEARSTRESALERWQRIVIEACKQCKRPIPMQIAEPIATDQLDFSPFAHKLLAWEEEKEQPLPANFLRENPGPICLFLGPEGGLHADEVHSLRAQGFLSFSLGKKVLRAETATLAAISIVQYLSGALRP